MQGVVFITIIGCNTATGCEIHVASLIQENLLLMSLFSLAITVKANGYICKAGNSIKIVFATHATRDILQQEKKKKKKTIPE